MSDSAGAFARDAAVLSLPVITGLNGLIWAEVVIRSGSGIATACGAAAYLVVSLAAFMMAGPTTASSGQFGLAAMLVVLNCVTAALWLVPIAGGTRYVSLALIEGAWPVFSILFGWLLFGRREIDITSCVGGALILIGAALVFHKA